MIRERDVDGSAQPRGNRRASTVESGPDVGRIEETMGRPRSGCGSREQRSAMAAGHRDVPFRCPGRKRPGQPMQQVDIPIADDIRLGATAR